jgi:hypothetical protein
MEAVCTLYEGDYHFGVAALFNSIHRSGFRGKFWVGYRGALPPWVDQTLDRLVPVERDSSHPDVRFVKLDFPLHLAHYKPRFIQEIFEVHDPEVQSVYYFDPDITVRCSWSFMQRWVECGVAVCEDTASPLYHTHPLRQAWSRFQGSEQHSSKSRSTLDVYLNSGFLGLHRKNLQFAREWWAVLCRLSNEGVPMSTIKNGIREDTFHVPDQDTLNVAFYSTSCPISVVGKEGMDFVPGGHIMSHAINRPWKPWNSTPIRSALAGVSPNRAEKEYSKYLDGPLMAHTTFQISLIRMHTLIASFLGRFIRRN